MILTPDFISVDQEIGLIESIDASGLTPFRFRGWQGKRLTMSYGSSFDFVSGRMLIGEPVPHWLNGLRGRAADFAGLPAKDLVHVQLTRYDPGAGINWHRDRPQYGHVVGVSLGAAAALRLRRNIEGKFKRFDVLLAPRSIYLLSGDARQHWEHSIGSLAATRWSITFRSLSLAGKAALQHALVAMSSTATVGDQR
ncbi:MAG: alpha-ketoglutarate-dependent dioxygenase AlkB [Acetobacteraceae bacterium]|nr:alpha-ketoglutarate-dependent dioxygenase AlkB [Acetobacteraceae bacterium]